MDDPVWLVSQAFGLVAFIVSNWALCMASDTGHRRTVSASALLDAMHWALISAYPAAFAALVIAARTSAADRLVGKASHLGALVFCSAFAIATWMAWEDAYSLLPLLAFIVATYAYIFSGGVALRAILVATNVPWIVYSLHVGSPVGAGVALFSMVLLLVTISRLKAGA